MFLCSGNHARVNINLDLRGCLGSLVRSGRKFALRSFETRSCSVHVDIFEATDLLSEDLDGRVGVDGGSSTADEELLYLSSFGGDGNNTGQEDSDSWDVVREDSEMSWNVLKTLTHSTIKALTSSF